MASPRPAPQQRAATLGHEQMRAAIPKLRRRISDLEAFDPRSLKQRYDPRLEALENKLTDTMADVFGHGTPEFHRFAPGRLDNAGINMDGTPLSHVIRSVEEGKERELLNLRTVIELFEEKLSDGAESPATKAKQAFGDLDLHPEIARACGRLFNDGHYAEAVEAACKVLDMLVKLRSLRTDPSGTELMQLVFSPRAPILKYNDLQTESDKSEQQGMMFLFSGAMLALRNPRAHGLVDDHPRSAIDYISFLSMLAKSLDRTKS